MACAIWNKISNLIVIILMSNRVVKLHAGRCKPPCEFSLSGGGTTVSAYHECCSDVPVMQGVPAAEISIVKTIYLHKNKLETVFPGAFSDLGGFSNLSKDSNTTYPEIETINLSNNEIHFFSFGSFDGTENSLKTLDLQSNRIENLELIIPYLPTTLVYLNLDENIHIQTVPTKIFEHFHNIKVLTISGDDKDKPTRHLAIEPGAFFGMTNLERIDLSGMGITSLPENTFSDNTFLSNINLQNNKLLYLDSQLFDNLANLTYLVISKNRLQSFPLIYCGERCFKLQTLDIRKNEITDLPGLNAMFPNLKRFYASENKLSDVEKLCFENMTSLITVDISKNSITEMPELCGNCPKNVGSFSFHTNQMTTVKQFVLEGMVNYANTIDLSKFSQMVVLQRLSAYPLNANTITATEGGIQRINSTFFTNMTNLRSFTMTLNALTETPPFGMECPMLHSINLCQNKIITIHNETFLNLPHLQTLILCDNLIAQIPEYIQLPASLERLDLSKNLLSSLNATVQNLIFLTNLTLTKNIIESVPFNTFVNLTALQYLAIDDNLIEYVNESDGCCPNLRVLKMNKNHLSTIPISFLMDVAELQELHLQENKLSSLPEIGNKSKHLSYVDISKNHLSTIPENIFKDTALQTLKMYNNKIDIFPNLQTVNDTIMYIHGRNNSIRSLDETANVFMEFGNLRILDLSMNEIATLPPEEMVYGMDQLKLLNLSMNKIESFPDKWHEFPMLKVIDFQENELLNCQNFTPLSKTLLKLNLSQNNLADENCNNLTLEVLIHLNMSHNEYRSTPNLYNMTSLKVLDLSWNQISFLPYNWSTGFRDTVYLFLQHNKIQDIAQGVLLELHQLKELNMSHNMLSEFINITELSECIDIVSLDYNQIENFDLPDDAPEDFRTSLGTLTMSHNNIRAISVSFLKAAEELQILDLMSNQIKQFGDHLLDHIEMGTIHTHITLTNNDLQLICGRQICKVLDYLDPIFIVDEALTPCAYPVRVYDLTWAEMITPEVGYEAIRCRRKYVTLSQTNYLINPEKVEKPYQTACVGEATSI